jgi:hypothetical protein
MPRPVEVVCQTDVEPEIVRPKGTARAARREVIQSNESNREEIT